MKANNTLKLIFSFFICQLAGFVGSLYTYPAIGEWYVYLRKPSFAPPNGLFAPVWITLYFMMGGALFIVWKKGWHRREVMWALVAFFIQLVLNTLWSIIFFGLRSPFYGLLEIAALWVAIAVTVFLFSKVSKWATWLMVPYLCWTGFAVFLNHAIWKLN